MVLHMYSFTYVVRDLVSPAHGAQRVAMAGTGLPFFGSRICKYLFSTQQHTVISSLEGVCMEEGLQYVRKIKY